MNAYCSVDLWYWRALPQGKNELEDTGMYLIDTQFFGGFGCEDYQYGHNMQQYISEIEKDPDVADDRPCTRWPLQELADPPEGIQVQCITMLKRIRMVVADVSEEELTLLATHNILGVTYKSSEVIVGYENAEGKWLGESAFITEPTLTREELPPGTKYLARREMIRTNVRLDIALSKWPAVMNVFCKH